MSCSLSICKRGFTISALSSFLIIYPGSRVHARARAASAYIACDAAAAAVDGSLSRVYTYGARANI